MDLIWAGALVITGLLTLDELWLCDAENPGQVTP
jgi:hypothetical protein